MTPDQITLAKAVRAVSTIHTGLDWSEEQHLKSRRLSPKQERRLRRCGFVLRDRLPPEAQAALDRLEAVSRG